MDAAGHIRTFDPGVEQGWDAFSSEHPDGSIFHSAGWARVLCASYGHKPHFLAAMNGDRPGALLPILEVNTLLKGRRGIALPFSDEGGLLCFDGNDGSGVFERALELGRQRRWKYLEVRGKIPCRPDAPAWDTFVGHEINLTGGDEAIFGRFENSVRRAIRKAEKSNVKAHVLRTPAAMRTYHALHCQTRLKHGVPPQAFPFFNNIFEHVIKPGGGFVVVAEHEGRAVAAGVFLHHGRNGIYKFGASDASGLHLRGNDLVMWEAIKTCAGLGCEVFSMGRTAPENAGLRRFKCGFGAHEHAINYHRYDLRREMFVARSGEQNGRTNKILNLMPMPLFRLIGKMLYPQMD
jgi:hypothetical protein